MTDMNKAKLKWVRSHEDSILAGVAAGLAKQLDVAPWLVRIGWVLAAFCTFGGALLLYLGCVIALPREDRQERGLKKMVLGVCSKIHERGDLEVGLARLLALTLLVLTGGAAIVGYIVLYFVLSGHSASSATPGSQHPQC